MSGQPFRELLTANPFRPFIVYLPNERCYSIQYPEVAILTPKGMLNTAAVLLDVLTITRAEVRRRAA